MPYTPSAESILMATLLLLVASICITLGGARLLLPPRKRIRAAITYLSRVQRIHAHRRSRRRHNKTFRYRLAGLSAQLAGAFGLYSGFKVLLESAF